MSANAIETEQLLPPPRSAEPLTSAETAECTCPEWCERDHERD